MIAALTQHHQYADSGCLNFEPIGVNEFARQATVSSSSASGFFKGKFGGHTKYKNLYCVDGQRLVAVPSS